VGMGTTTRVGSPSVLLSCSISIFSFAAFFSLRAKDLHALLFSQTFFNADFSGVEDEDRGRGTAGGDEGVRPMMNTSASSLKSTRRLRLVIRSSQASQSVSWISRRRFLLSSFCSCLLVGSSETLPRARHSWRAFSSA